MFDEYKAYDLNVFFMDLGHDDDGVNQWEDVYTIQPSLYYSDSENNVSRMYMESFKLTLGETRALQPDFPEDQWGDDFFIELDSFRNIAKAMPDRVAKILDSLPPIESVIFDSDNPEYEWINTLF